jgi:hypothetical protein
MTDNFGISRRFFDGIQWKLSRTHCFEAVKKKKSYFTDLSGA